eukprot:TRINITY_DN6210_c0_g1_i1.p1 TRINITY_DN6210_c0_g1~~TRINITY_DN6210_c0_g1_i1.p1  ORF type:complete len:1228 (+),score=278.93 TRINITY_DN6210_c0_g1_i1:481-3684(+)
MPGASFDTFQSPSSLTSPKTATPVAGVMEALPNADHEDFEPAIDEPAAPGSSSPRTICGVAGAVSRCRADAAEVQPDLVYSSSSSHSSRPCTPLAVDAPSAVGEEQPPDAAAFEAADAAAAATLPAASCSDGSACSAPHAAAGQQPGEYLSVLVSNTDKQLVRWLASPPPADQPAAEVLASPGSSSRARRPPQPQRRSPSVPRAGDDVEVWYGGQGDDDDDRDIDGWYAAKCIRVADGVFDVEFGSGDVVVGVEPSHIRASTARQPTSHSRTSTPDEGLGCSLFGPYGFGGSARRVSLPVMTDLELGPESPWQTSPVRPPFDGAAADAETAGESADVPASAAKCSAHPSAGDSVQATASMIGTPSCVTGAAPPPATWAGAAPRRTCSEVGREVLESPSSAPAACPQGEDLPDAVWASSLSVASTPGTDLLADASAVAAAMLDAVAPASAAAAAPTSAAPSEATKADAEPADEDGKDVEALVGAAAAAGSEEGSPASLVATDLDTPASPGLSCDQDSPAQADDMLQRAARLAVKVFAVEPAQQARALRDASLALGLGPPPAGAARGDPLQLLHDMLRLQSPEPRTRAARLLLELSEIPERKKSLRLSAGDPVDVLRGREWVTAVVVQPRSQQGRVTVRFAVSSAKEDEVPSICVRRRIAWMDVPDIVVSPSSPLHLKDMTGFGRPEPLTDSSSCLATVVPVAPRGPCRARVIRSRGVTVHSESDSRRLGDPPTARLVEGTWLRVSDADSRMAWITAPVVGWLKVASADGRVFVSEIVEPPYLDVDMPADRKHKQLSGSYRLTPEKANGESVWRSDTGLYWLYSGGTGHWHIGGADVADRRFSVTGGWVTSAQPHNAVPPWCIERWMRYTENPSGRRAANGRGGEFKEVAEATIRIGSCPPPADAAADGGDGRPGSARIRPEAVRAMMESMASSRNDYEVSETSSSSSPTPRPLRRKAAHALATAALAALAVAAEPAEEHSSSPVPPTPQQFLPHDRSRPLARISAATWAGRTLQSPSSSGRERRAGERTEQEHLLRQREQQQQQQQQPAREKAIPKNSGSCGGGCCVS